MKGAKVAKLIVLAGFFAIFSISCTAPDKRVEPDQGLEERTLASDEESRSQASEEEDTPPVEDVDSTKESSSRVPPAEEATNEDAPPEDATPEEEDERIEDLRAVLASTIDMVDLLDPDGVAYLYILDDEGEGTSDELAHELGFRWMSTRYKLYCGHELADFARYLQSVHLESRSSPDFGFGAWCRDQHCFVRAVEGVQGGLALRYNERNRIDEVRISGFGMGVPPEDGHERLVTWLEAKRAELEEQSCPEEE